jgi:hypothetical protein
VKVKDKNLKCSFGGKQSSNSNGKKTLFLRIFCGKQKKARQKTLQKRHTEKRHREKRH